MTTTQRNLSFSLSGNKNHRQQSEEEEEEEEEEEIFFIDASSDDEEDEEQNEEDEYSENKTQREESINSEEEEEEEEESRMFKESSKSETLNERQTLNDLLLEKATNKAKRYKQRLNHTLQDLELEQQTNSELKQQCITEREQTFVWKQKHQKQLEHTQDLESRLQTYLKQLEKLKNDYKTRLHENNVLLNKNEQLSNEIASLNNVQKENEQHIAMTEENVKIITDLRFALEQKNSENEALHAKHESLNECKTRYEKQLSEAIEEKEKFKTEFKSVKEKNENLLSTISFMKESNQTQLEKLQKQSQISKESNEQLKQNLETLNSRLEETELKSSTLSQELSVAKYELEKLSTSQQNKQTHPPIENHPLSKLSRELNHNIQLHGNQLRHSESTEWSGFPQTGSLMKCCSFLSQQAVDCFIKQIHSQELSNAPESRNLCKYCHMAGCLVVKLTQELINSRESTEKLNTELMELHVKYDILYLNIKNIYPDLLEYLLA